MEVWRWWAGECNRMLSKRSVATGRQFGRAARRRGAKLAERRPLTLSIMSCVFSSSGALPAISLQRQGGVLHGGQAVRVDVAGGGALRV